jgi:hypothetical protein
MKNRWSTVSTEGSLRTIVRFVRVKVCHTVQSSRLVAASRAVYEEALQLSPCFLGIDMRFWAY